MSSSRKRGSRIVARVIPAQAGIQYLEARRPRRQRPRGPCLVRQLGGPQCASAGVMVLGYPLCPLPDAPRRHRPPGRPRSRSKRRLTSFKDAHLFLWQQVTRPLYFRFGVFVVVSWFGVQSACPSVQLSMWLIYCIAHFAPAIFVRWQQQIQVHPYFYEICRR